MTGFENYSITNWMVECLSRHPASEARAHSKRRAAAAKSWRVGILAPLVAVGVMNLTISTSVFAASSYSPEVATGFHPNVTSISGSPIAYWSSAIAEIQGWSAVEDSEIMPPPPVF
jgi:hypothetical protein